MRIEDQVAQLGPGPLTEEGLREHVWPLFSRTLSSVQEIYLANHSLGRPLDQMAEDVRQALDAWYDRMDGAWDPWFAAVGEYRSMIAQMIGLSEASGVVPKTSAGQGLRAVLNSFDQPIRVLATAGEFDSIDHILKVYEAKGRVQVTWIEPELSDVGVPWIEPEKVLEAIQPGLDLVIVSRVYFSTGQALSQIDEMTQRAHSVGALILVDTYHAAGVLPLAMESECIDFMIGGCYKYLRGGPGACWLAIHPSILDSGRRTLDTGWFAKRNPFSYARPEPIEYGERGDSWLESTAPVITQFQALAGLRLTLALGIDRLRAYNLAQQDFLRQCLDEVQVPSIKPVNPDDFGAFALVPADDATGFAAELRRHGVNTDARGRTVRFGPDVLTTRDELKRAAQRTAQVFASRLQKA